MYTAAKSCVALPGALLTTVLLFWCMHLLISTGLPDVHDTTSPLTIEFVKPFEMTEVIPDRPDPKAPPPPELAPAAPELTLAGGGIPISGVILNAPVVDEDVGSFNVSEGPAVPLVHVQPRYPRRALAQGIEGFVIVEFDIGHTGMAESPRIIAGHPKGVFEAAALDAVSRIRFKPNVKNGISTPVYGIRKRFVFSLEN